MFLCIYITYNIYYYTTGVERKANTEKHKSIYQVKLIYFIYVSNNFLIETLSETVKSSTNIFSPFF